MYICVYMYLWTVLPYVLVPTWGPSVPPTPTRTAKLVRCVLEHCTVTKSPSLVALTVVIPSADQVVFWRLYVDMYIHVHNTTYQAQ